MDILKEGTIYRLENYSSNGNQELVFTERLEEGYRAGTTNEEVVNVLIDRFYHLQKNNFSAENQCIILLLKNVRRMLAKRLNRKIGNVKKYNEQTSTPT